MFNITHTYYPIKGGLETKLLGEYFFDLLIHFYTICDIYLFLCLEDRRENKTYFESLVITELKYKSNVSLSKMC